MSEAFTQAEKVTKAEGGYDRESVREEAVAQMQDLLDEIPDDESLDAEIDQARKLYVLRAQLDQPNVSNELRHVSRVLDYAVDDMLVTLSHKKYMYLQEVVLQDTIKTAA